MHQLHRKHTGYVEISTVNNIDNEAFQMYQTTVKRKALRSLTHNLSSLIEKTYYTSCLPTLTYT